MMAAPQSADGRLPPGVRLVIYGLCLAVCSLAYVHVLPTPIGIAGAAVVPFLWLVEAYRRQSRTAFLLAALVLFIALVPLIKYLRP